jgi:predicted ATPase/class 3 adenylate cyclase
VHQLPTGTVTLLFTDIEGSTRLLQRLGERYASVLKKCRHLLRMAFQQGNGYEVDTQGDAFFVVFERAADAVEAALIAQRALFSARWPDETHVCVRMGMHTGEPQPAEEGYIGLDVHCAARIMSAAHGGQVLLSQATHDLVAHELSGGVSLRDLGEYRLKDIAGLNRLFQLVVPDLPADFPPPSTASSKHPLHNIPSPSTSFIGREQEVSAACNLLRRAEVRLLTLIGTAGVGKTRLALQVAEALAEQFTDGASFVALDQVSDADGVVPAIAQALTIQEEKGHSLVEQLKMALREQVLLLVLDNFEQVMPARLAVAELLAGCPKLKVLVTSRVMLYLQAEHLFEVPPLPLPEPGQRRDVGALSHYASIALFVQRAQAVQPDFQLTPANAAAVAEICVRLDGIPLAIELAAARTRHLPPHTLLVQLAQGVAVLQGRARDVPARQQTLRGAIAWSYDLLGTAEQRVFRRLAVCSNGATLEAAEQVCTAAGAIDGGVPEVLEALVDNSMLQRQEREGEMRFWLLQTLREYGLERLAEAEEQEATQAAHAAYYLSWVEQAAPLLLGAEQADWLDRLDREYENVRAALEWMLAGAQVETERTEQALRLCVALMVFWEIRGYISEGLAFLERALRGDHGIAPAVKAQALHGAGFLALMQDDNARAEAFLRESQLLFRESGDRAGMANILRLQGNLAMVRNSYKVARRLLEEALAIYRERGDTPKMAATREALAQVAIAQCDYTRAHALLEEDLAFFRARGEQYNAAYPLYYLARALFLARDDRAEAKALAEESLDLFRAVGNRRLVAYALSLKGQMLLVEREDERARSMLEESLAIFKAVGDRSCAAEALIALARLAAYRGENEAALACYTESWGLLRAIGARELSATCLEGCGEVALAQGEPGWAARLWGTAATVRAAIVAPMPPIYRTDYTRAVTTAREQLGEEAFQAAWAEGRAIPLEQVELVQ